MHKRGSHSGGSQRIIALACAIVVAACGCGRDGLPSSEDIRSSDATEGVLGLLDMADDESMLAPIDAPVRDATNTCFDHALDGDETDVDCGGSCASCALLKGCRVNADCQTTSCVHRHCVPATLLTLGFATPVQSGAGSMPDAIAAADLNGDGIDDVAVANFGGNTVSVLLGSSTGLGVAVNFPCGQNPAAVQIADIDGDTRLDILTANSGGTGSVGVLVNKGFGAFQAASAIPAGGALTSIAIGDLNNDGRLDVVATTANDVSVVTNLGSMKFSSPVFFPSGESSRSPSIGDFNGDGNLDVAAANSDGTTGNSISVLLGDGHGGLTPSTTYPVDRRPMALGCADFNGDGLLDLASANFAGNDITMLANSGSGRFGPFGNVTVGAQPQGIAVGDLNLDGWPDLVVTNYLDNTISLLINSGTGTLHNVSNLATGNGPLGVVVADVNGDGKPDIIATAAQSGTVTTFLNTSQ